MAQKDGSLFGSRSAKYGAWLLIAAAVQFVLCMVIVQLAFPCTNGQCYNLLTNPISDLGSAGYGSFPMSHLWYLFNYSIVLFCVLGTAGLLLMGGWFPKDRFRSGGLTIIIISLFASAGVGVVPEDTILKLHSLFALIAFVGAGLGLLILSIGLLRSRRNSYAAFSLACALISLVVVIIFMLPNLGILPQWIHSGPGFGFGGMERLTAAPVLLWLIVTGIIVATRKRA